MDPRVEKFNKVSESKGFYIIIQPHWDWELATGNTIQSYDVNVGGTGAKTPEKMIEITGRINIAIAIAMRINKELKAGKK